MGDNGQAKRRHPHGTDITVMIKVIIQLTTLPNIPSKESAMTKLFGQWDGKETSLIGLVRGEAYNHAPGLGYDGRCMATEYPTPKSLSITCGTIQSRLLFVLVAIESAGKFHWNIYKASANVWTCDDYISKEPTQWKAVSCLSLWGIVFLKMIAL